MLLRRATANPKFDAPYNKLQRRARLLYVNIKFNGVFQTSSILALNVAKRLKLHKAPVAKLGQSRNSSDLDVHGIVNVANLAVPDEKRDAANRYEPTPELEFRHVLESLRIHYPVYDFIDFGSGKGAILATAAQYPFIGVTGVEFCSQLHASAKRNILQIVSPECGPIKSVNIDARDFQIASAPFVAFLYNPFNFDILKPVVEKCWDATRRSDRPSFLLYKNPFHRPELDLHPSVKLIAEPFGGSWAVYQFTKH